MHKLQFIIKPSLVIGFLGAAVVLMWGATAWLRLLAVSVPPLELTGIALLAAAVCSRLLPGSRSLLSTMARHYPWYVWPVVGIGLVGGAGFYFAALAWAPAAQTVVITYSWPLLFAIASDVHGGRRPSPLTLAGLLLAFAGVYVMQESGQGPFPHAWLGYACGVASGLCWVLYSLFLQVCARSIEPDYPAFFSFAAVLALLLQAVFGGFVWPQTTSAWLAISILGIGPYGLGFMAWGYVVHNGNPRVIPVLPYAVPAVAAGLLVLTGHSQPTMALIVGCALVGIACAAIMIDPAVRKSKAGA